jgi:general secretion pathway protein G
MNNTQLSIKNTLGISILINSYKVNNKNYKKAFSLMELMVVIIILGLLASFVLPSLTGKSEQAKSKIACIQMKSVGQALKMYKIDNSKYPDGSLDDLASKGYFENQQAPTDPWKHPFIYTNSGKEFEIISLGADGTEGGEDDIYYSKCQ